MSETRDELEAAIAARAETGAELESHVIDGFVERIEKRIDQRARELQPRRSGPNLVIVLGSMALGDPAAGHRGRDRRPGRDRSSSASRSCSST